MQAGRELDKLICERIFKRKVFLHKSPTNREDYFMEIEGGIAPVPTYSTNIKNAFDVVAWMRYESGHGYLLELSLNGDDTWWCSFKDGRAVTGETAPHAICLAALRAVEPS